ncbi:suppressor of glycerol defect, partial [Coemansia sp. RSA 2611]
MPPKRRIQSNAVLPASLAKQLADEGASNDKRFTKRFKNTAGSRKAARKQLRTEKKERKNQHHKRIKGFAQPQRADNKEKAVKPAEQKPAVAKSAEAKPRPKPKPKAEDERAQLVKFAQRNQGMYTLLRESNLIGNVDKEAGVQSKTNAAEELEDREMRRLERHLGIKNNAKLGSAFYDEGLGDMLEGIEFGSNDIRKPTEQSKRDEVSETGSMESNSEGSGVEDSDMNAEEAGSDMASDNGDDDDAFGLNNMDMDTGSESDDSDIAEMYRNQGVDADPDLSDIDSDGSDVDSDESDNSDIGSGVDDNSDDSASDEEMASEEKAVSDKDVAPAAGGAGRYIPPSLRRKQTEEVEDERVAAIRKTLQGQLNRLSESNIEGIVVQIEGQYQKYPRHYVTSVLTSLILQSIESRINVLDTFLYVNAAIVGAVYRIVGLEPVAHLVQTLMEEFERRFVQSLGEFKAHGAADAMLGKECQNLCVFVAELYNFQVVSCQLVYDMIRLCIEDINEFTAELLLKVIRISGQQLRKDDPLALKEIVRQVTEKVGKMGKLSARCRFMVESLTSLKD